jgi:hypothetical protein
MAIRASQQGDLLHHAPRKATVGARMRACPAIASLCGYAGFAGYGVRSLLLPQNILFWGDGHKTPLSPDLLQQRLRFLEIRDVKALGEPAVDQYQQYRGTRCLVRNPASAVLGRGHRPRSPPHHCGEASQITVLIRILPVNDGSSLSKVVMLAAQLCITTSLNINEVCAMCPNACLPCYGPTGMSTFPPRRRST